MADITKCENKKCKIKELCYRHNAPVYIYFYKDKSIEVASDYSLSYKVFQAINKQVEELGWNNESKGE